MESSQRALAVAASGTLVSLVAFTAPLAIIGATASGLGTNTSGRTWILSSMSIGLGAALLTCGTLADDYGRRRTFVAGCAVLAVGSILCAVAPGVLIFVLARVLQGIGAAAVVASSLGIISHAFPPGPSRAAASGVWGASVGGGIALGPVVAAAFEHLASWRDIYWLLTAASVALAVAAFTVEESTSERRRGLDLPGALTLAGGVSALLAALVEGRSGWGQPRVLLLMALAVVLSALFLVVEKRSRTAMLDLALFRHAPFVAATAAAAATGAGIIALMSYMAGFVNSAYQVTAFGAAMMILAWSGTSVVTALLACRIPPRVSGRMQLVIGLAGVALGQLMLVGVGTDSSWGRFLPGLLVAGVASGVLNAALGREAVASVPDGRGGLGSGANNTARYVGAAVGVTVVAVIASRPGSSSAAELATGWNHAAIVTAALSSVGAAVVFAAHRRVSKSATRTAR